MINPTGKFIWYELWTTDAAAAESFYSDVVGWQVSDAGMPNMDYRLVNAGDIQIGGIMQLDQGMLDGGARPAWLGYVSVPDVDAFVERVTGDGCSVHVPPSDIPDVGRFALIADPQGISIYVMHDTGDTPSRAFEPTSVGHCSWNELATADSKAALDFYCRHFGWTPGDTMSMGPMGDYLMFDLGDETIGGIFPSEPNGPVPIWRYYFRVANLAEAGKKITSGGGAVIHGPQQVPGGDEILIGVDPQGAQFAVVAAIAAAD